LNTGGWRNPALLNLFASEGKRKLKSENRFDAAGVKTLFLTIIALFVISVLIQATAPGAITGFSNGSAITGYNDVAAVPATGTFSFGSITQNVSNGEAANITDPSGFKWIFEFNTTGMGGLAQDTCYVYRASGGCIPVNVSYGMGWNSSTYASGNLSRAINNNVSTSANTTATNTTTVVTLTAVNAGKSGNSFVLSDNAVNITSSGLSGGADAKSGWTGGQKNAYQALPGLYAIGLVIIMIILLLLALSYL